MFYNIDVAFWLGRGRCLGYMTKKETDLVVSLFHFFELSYLDSNQDKQNQNLLCYHYTIGQSSVFSFRKFSRCLKDGAKIEVFLYPCKLLVIFLLCDEQEVVLLTALHEQVFVVE